MEQEIVLIRQCRKQRGLTQKQVAEHLGMNSIDRISKWEHGTLHPHVLTAIKLAKFLEVRVEDLYQTGEGN